MGRALEGSLDRRPLEEKDGQERWAWVGRVAGRKETLGRYPEMSEAKARRGLADMVGSVARDEWKPRPPTPPKAPTPEPVEVPDVHDIVTDFLKNLKHRRVTAQKQKGKTRVRRRVAGEAQIKDIEGLLTTYVLRHLRRPDGSYPTPAELDVRAVEAFRDDLAAERERLDNLRTSGVTHLGPDGPLKPGGRGGAPLPKGLGPRRINRAIHALWRALDYGSTRYGTPDTKQMREADELLLAVDTVEGPHLTCGQIWWLLEAARQEETEASSRSRHLARLAPTAVLALAGPRLGEMCNLRLMDIETGQNRWRISIPDSKTSAGKRRISVTGYLRPVLAAHLMRRRAEGATSRDPLFCTSNKRAISKDNFRSREFARIIARADQLCIEHGVPPIPGIAQEADENEPRATPHALRRSYITHQAARGVPPKTLMRWVGHKDAKVTIEIYERVEDLDDADPLLPVLYGDDEPVAPENVVSLPVR